jgi:predicted lipoprotein with Yx(FWY)xxD motif
MRVLTTVAVAALSLASPSPAQQAETAPAAVEDPASSSDQSLNPKSTYLDVAESDEYGEYLTDADGRPVYLFTADTQASEGSPAQIACDSECLENWPLVTVEGNTAGEEGATGEMIGTVDHAEHTVLTYNGWPLYYFVNDEGADGPQGHDKESFGGEWYLVSPSGEHVEDKG